MSQWSHRYAWGNTEPRARVQGQRCRVLARGAFQSVAILTEDGTTLVTSRRALRRLEKEEATG